MTTTTPHLDEQDCLSVLRSKLQNDHIKLFTHEVQSIDEKRGFQSFQYRLKCKIINSNGEIEMHTFFIKVRPAENTSPIEDLFRSVSLFVREIEFYQLFNNEINQYLNRKFCPTFYAALNERYIALEDVMLSGYQPVKQSLFNWDLEHCRTALDTVAVFHTFSLYLAQKCTTNIQEWGWILQETYPKLLTYVKFYDNTIGLGKQFLEAQCKMLSFLINECLELTTTAQDEFFCFMQHYVAFGVQRLKTPSDRYINVINHGDLWGNNMLFKYDDSEQSKINDVYLVDFQMIHYSPPVVDVLKLIMINTSLNFQQTHLDELMEHYYNKLTVEVAKLGGIELETIFPRDEFHAACADYMMDVKINAFSYKIILMPAIQQLIANYEFMFGDRIRFLEEAFNGDERDTYRQYYTPLVKDAYVTYVKYNKRQAGESCTKSELTVE